MEGIRIVNIRRHIVNQADISKEVVMLKPIDEVKLNFDENVSDNVDAASQKTVKTAMP